MFSCYLGASLGSAERRCEDGGGLYAASLCRRGPGHPQHWTSLLLPQGTWAGTDHIYK